MSIGHDEIDLGRLACYEIFKNTQPALFTLLRAGRQRRYLFVVGHVHYLRREDHRRIGLVAMAHASNETHRGKECANALADGTRAGQ
jgi:hypothetical protein